MILIEHGCVSVLDAGRVTTVDERAIYNRVEAPARAQIARPGLPVETKWPLIR